MAEKSPPKSESDESVASSSRNRGAVTREETSQSDPSRQARDEQSVAVTDLLRRAEDALKMKDQSRAAEFYLEVVRLQPDHKGALHRLAILNDINGDFPRAEIFFRRALEVDPNDANLLNDAGYAYLRQQRLDESEQYLQSSLKFEPDNQTTLGNLGILYALQGKSDLAHEYFQRGGMTDEAAHREFAEFLSSISSPVASQRSASIDELAKSQNAPTVSGQFAPPSTDLEATYGLKSDSPPREFERNSPEYQNQPFTYGPPNVLSSPIDTPPTTGSQENSFRDISPVASQPSFSPSHSNYDLERAALNAGPGSLFPIVASNQPAGQKPILHPPFAGLQDWNTVQPVGFGEPASSQGREIPRDDSSQYYSRVPPESPPFIQSPQDRYSESQPYSIDSTGFPVTQEGSNSGSRITPSYYQFPGKTPSQPANPNSDDDSPQFSGGPVYR